MTQVHASDNLGTGPKKALDSAVGECAKYGGETSGVLRKRVFKVIFCPRSGSRKEVTRMGETRSRQESRRPHPEPLHFLSTWQTLNCASRVSSCLRPTARGSFRRIMTSWLRRSLRHWMGRKPGLHYPEGCTLSRTLANDSPGEGRFRRSTHVGGTSGFCNADAICFYCTVANSSDYEIPGQPFSGLSSAIRSEQ